MWFWGDQAERQRQALLKKHGEAIPAAVLQYLQTPLPDWSLPADQHRYVALDFETTGLDAKKEAILSIGYTVIENGRVQLAQSGHHIIRTNINIPAESITIHGITHDRMQQGEALHDVMEEVLVNLAGSVLLVHYAQIERTFINMYCQRQYGFSLPLRLVDTLAIELNTRRRAGRIVQSNQLRLFNLRNDYNLPRYQAHDARMDAIATAELFLGQLAYRGEGELRGLVS